MTRSLITQQGHKSLQEQLDQLRKVELPANVIAIEEARAHGDLSENAEYHAAKERNAIIMGKIAEIKNILATAEIVHPLPDPNGGWCSAAGPRCTTWTATLSSPIK